MKLLRRTFSTPLSRLAGAGAAGRRVTAFFGPWLRPYSPIAQDVNALFAGPERATTCSAPTTSAATRSAA